MPVSLARTGRLFVAAVAVCLQGAACVPATSIGAVKTNRTALQHPCVWYQSEELCQLEELC